MPTEHTDTDGLTRLLRDRGLRVTSQRLVIFRTLRASGRHCTAEELGVMIADELPGCSKPTLYATLQLLISLGLVRQIDAGTGAALYDAGAPHHPAVCRVCGTVVDIGGTVDHSDAVRAAAQIGFNADRGELLLYGTCGACRKT